MKHTILAITLAATHCLLANASGLPSKTERQDILSRLKARSPHKWFARQAQPLPSNAVCPAENQPTADDACCPPDNVYDLNCAGVDYCCYGEIYSGPRCCPPGGEVYTSSDEEGNLDESCCAQPEQLTEPDANGARICCPPNQLPSGTTCTDRSTRKRSLAAGEKPGMTKRQGSAHTLLSAELVAKHLTQNGIFVHEGEEYIDEEHRQLNDNVFRHLIGKGITGGLRYYMRKNKKTFSDVIDTVFHIPLTSTYEFAVEDVPEIYARIVSDPSFVDFKWNGMTFDREILQQLAAGHPGYSEELVTQFAQKRSTLEPWEAL